MHITSLDGIRGTAALMIMFFHFMPGFDKAQHPVFFYLKKISIAGQCGVPLFFVLSGFLITRILLNSKACSNYFKLFYLKRLLRIFPLYYLYLFFSFILIPVFSGRHLPDWQLTWYYYFYLQNIPMTFNYKIADLPHLWSLAVEEHFYLFWPLVIYYFSDRAVMKVIGAVIAFAFVCRVLLIHYGYGTFYFTFTTFDSLAIGAFIAFNEIYAWLNRKNMYRIMLVTAIPLILLFAITSGSGNDYVQYFKNPIISLFCMCVIGLASLKDRYINKVFNNGFLKYTGKVSYGLYVWHPTCFIWAYSIFKPDNFFINLVVCFSAAYLVATVSYYLFETRFLKLKNRLEPRKMAT